MSEDQYTKRNINIDEFLRTFEPDAGETVTETADADIHSADIDDDSITYEVQELQDLTDESSADDASVSDDAQEARELTDKTANGSDRDNFRERDSLSFELFDDIDELLEEKLSDLEEAEAEAELSRVVMLKTGEIDSLHQFPDKDKSCRHSSGNDSGMNASDSGFDSETGETGGSDIPDAAGNSGISDRGADGAGHIPENKPVSKGLSATAYYSDLATELEKEMARQKAEMRARREQGQAAEGEPAKSSRSDRIKALREWAKRAFAIKALEEDDENEDLVEVYQDKPQTIMVRIEDKELKADEDYGLGTDEDTEDNTEDEMKSEGKGKTTGKTKAIKASSVSSSGSSAKSGGTKSSASKGGSKSGTSKGSSTKSASSGSGSAKAKSSSSKKTVSGNTKSNKQPASQSGGKSTSGKTSVKAGAGTTAKPAAQVSSGKTNKKKNKKNKKKRKRSKLGIFFKTLIATVFVLCLVGGIAGGAYAAYVISNAEVIHPKSIYDTLSVSTHIYDDKEVLVDEIYFNENREIVRYEQLPENLKNAFIAVEDKTFWKHKGFNFKRIIGAILERFHGGRISGTSTITQQLARNVFLPEDKSERSIKRKITEMYYAYEIEQELSKEEILTAYLNTIYLGYGCYGVDTAARKYFSVDVEDLTLEQCAALAALPQAPGAYALLTTEKGDHTTKIQKGLYANDASKDRRNMILRLMQSQGYITKSERKEATKDLIDFIKPGTTSAAASKSAFKDYLIETVIKDLMKEYDLTEEQATKIVYTKGLNIYSTMDRQAQKAITKQFKNSDNFPTVSKKGSKVEAAMVVTEIGTGEIKAMVGTRKQTGQMMFNRATNPRQPGSSIKPLTVYAAALQKSYEYSQKGQTFPYVETGYDRQGTTDWGDYITVSSEVDDEPMTINGKNWPLNVTRTYSGYNTFRTAIQKSINTCAVKILAQVGIDYSMNMLKQFGVTSAVDDPSEPHNDLNYAALGLGAMTYGISPLEMSAAYAVFPNGGVRNTTIIYTKVEDANGRTLLEAKSEESRVLDEGVAWIMTNVLQSVVTNGIAYNAKVEGVKVGGKTGTTNDRYDIWFNGFTPSYSAALWIGTDDNVQMSTMSETAAALWSKCISNISRAKTGEYRSMPSNVSYWLGDYYTRGTEPPEPEPEEEEEEEEDGDKESGKKSGSKSGKSGKKSKDSDKDD